MICDLFEILFELTEDGARRDDLKSAHLYPQFHYILRQNYGIAVLINMSSKKLALMIIDPQVDFHPPTGSLAASAAVAARAAVCPSPKALWPAAPARAA